MLVRDLCSFIALVMVTSGFVMIIVSHVWLICLIAQGRPILGLVALVVPFFIWYFVWDNWDIAKRPFKLHVLGVLMIVAGFILEGLFKTGH